MTDAQLKNMEFTINTLSKVYDEPGEPFCVALAFCAAGGITHVFYLADKAEMAELIRVRVLETMSDPDASDRMFIPQRQ